MAKNLQKTNFSGKNLLKVKRNEFKVNLSMNVSQRSLSLIHKQMCTCSGVNDFFLYNSFVVKL